MLDLEPVAQYGPFVMNTRSEIEQTMAEYRRTQIGDWPWLEEIAPNDYEPDHEPTHGRDPWRFASHPDGRVEAGLSANLFCLVAFRRDLFAALSCCPGLLAAAMANPGLN